MIISIFIVLFLPLLQSIFIIREIYPLKGDVLLPNNIELHNKNWFSGEFQQQKETYLNSMFGFRPLFVKLNNQIAFNFFNKAKANGIIIGKENYLYEEGYINAYTGKDFIGEDSINNTINKLKFISDTLNKLGKQLIIVFAAGKASFYPEYIPDSYVPINEKTNYKSLSSKAIDANLNIIDFNKWFMDNKLKSKYPLYPQYGIHWSTYGSVLAADSIIKKIENLRHVDISNLKITDIKMEQPHDIDYDVADGMNLLFKLKSIDLAYPQIKMDDTTGKIKPKLLVIADSFYWGIYGLGISNCFKNDHFWYYNEQVYPESQNQELFTYQLKIGEEILKHDVVVIMASETNLKNMGWGFIENAFSFYKKLNANPVRSASYYIKLKEMVAAIRTNPTWMSEATIRAKDKGISLDSGLVLEAMWSLDNPQK